MLLAGAVYVHVQHLDPGDLEKKLVYINIYIYIYIYICYNNVYDQDQALKSYTKVLCVLVHGLERLTKCL